jgi:putative transposase
MKQGQFSDAQIVALLQEAEKGEKTIGALCREKGVSENTFYRWRSKFGGMQVKEAQRLKDLEKENARLKRLLAERDLELDIFKEALSKNWCKSACTRRRFAEAIFHAMGARKAWFV